MTSAVMSSESAVGSRHSAKKRWSQQEATVHQQMVLGVSDSKTMSFTSVDTTAFCPRTKDSADGLAMIKPAGTSSKNDQQAATVHPDTAAVNRKHFTTNDWTTSCKYIQTQSTVHSDESYSRPDVDMYPVAI
ncbi:hypothetical protein F511_46757 [Dorcoceras hygrometricum]|uniref:Uncharacterized protein n=1 Tax=Dorcoceras hygrometricum TaxID=472368 RepID=A0A2Z6ZZK5_9LAMI|nr:hypothetical protein F511_46757 [Dorcoceras hygrometricum]